MSRPYYDPHESCEETIGRILAERDEARVEVERLREDLQILRQARQEDYEVTRRLIGAEAEVERLRAEVGLCITEYDRLAATIQRIRDKASEWMRNESISADYQDALADAAEELLAALDGETSG